MKRLTIHSTSGTQFHALPALENNLAEFIWLALTAKQRENRLQTGDAGFYVKTEILSTPDEKDRPGTAEKTANTGLRKTVDNLEERLKKLENDVARLEQNHITDHKADIHLRQRVHELDKLIGLPRTIDMMSRKELAAEARQTGVGGAVPLPDRPADWDGGTPEESLKAALDDIDQSPRCVHGTEQGYRCDTCAAMRASFGQTR